MFFWVNPGNYLVKVIALLIGCAILGFGVYLEVLADVVMLPGESFVRAIVQTWNTNFGTTKIIFDTSMAVIAAGLSFLFSGKLNGVREGTIIAALLVGFIARVFGKKLEFIKPVLFPEEYKDQVKAAESQTDGRQYRKNVIVIGRQFGSGGHDIGKALAEKLGFSFYDQEIIKMAAGTTGYTQDFISKKEESMTNSLLYDLVSQVYMYAQANDEAPKDQIFEAEKKVIEELAQKGNCVIVGRCADYALADNENCLNIFIHADLDYRIARVSKNLDLTANKAKDAIVKADKQRASYYNYYTSKKWGDSKSYHLTLDSSRIGIEGCVDLILTYREHMKKMKK